VLAHRFDFYRDTYRLLAGTAIDGTPYFVCKANGIVDRVDADISWHIRLDLHLKVVCRVQSREGAFVYKLVNELAIFQRVSVLVLDRETSRVDCLRNGGFFEVAHHLCLVEKGLISRLNKDIGAAEALVDHGAELAVGLVVDNDLETYERASELLLR